MPKLKELNIERNKIDDKGKGSINSLRMDHIKVNYITEDEKRREKEKKKENKKNDN